MRTTTPAGPRSGGEDGYNKSCPKAKKSYRNVGPEATSRVDLEGVFEAVADHGPSALDINLTVTEFSDAKAKRKKERRLSLRELAPAIAKRGAPSKQELPWLKLATFGEVPSVRGGSLRHDANILAVNGVEGDYDGGTVGVDEAVRKLTRAGLAALVYTTPSHTPERPRWRVLCPLTEPASREAREALCARLNGVLGGVLAPESFTPSQSYYFGRVEGSAAPRVELVDGRPLDTSDDYLDVFAEGRGGESEPATASPEPAGDDGELRGEPDWARIESALAAIPLTARDDRERCWRPVGMALHSESEGAEKAFDLWDEWSQAGAKYDAADQRRVWESFGTGGRKLLRIGTLFRLAKEHGWSGKRQSDAAPSRLTFLSPGECAAAPSRGYVLKGILAPGDVGCIFGSPGAGKSLIAPHLGYRVAQALPAFGMRTRACGVFYVAAEDPHGMRGRVTALRMAHGDAEGFTLVEGVSDLLADESSDFAALMDAVESRRPGLIFLDTLAMAFPGLEENTAEGMGRVVKVARQLAEHGAAVVLIHHDTKAEGSTPRGHSLLNGALDMALQLFGSDEQGVVRGRLTKNRNGPCARDIAFRIATRELGVDEDGDAITAALVDELASDVAPKREKLTQSESAALDVLREMLDEGEEVDEAQWRETCKSSRRVSGSDNANAQWRAMDRAAKGLANKRRIAVCDGRVMLIANSTARSDDLEVLEVASEEEVL